MHRYALERTFQKMRVCVLYLGAGVRVCSCIYLSSGCFYILPLSQNIVAQEYTRHPQPPFYVCINAIVYYDSMTSVLSPATYIRINTPHKVDDRINNVIVIPYHTHTRTHTHTIALTHKYTHGPVTSHHASLTYTLSHIPKPSISSTAHRISPHTPLCVVQNFL